MTMQMIGGLPIHDLTGQLGEDYFKILVHGPQGSGKSTLASTLALLGPMLYIDMTGERGLRSFQGAAYSGNIKFIRPTTIAELDDVFHDLARGGHPFKTVVLDSATSVQKLTLRFLLGYSETSVKEIKRGSTGADQRTWGQALDIMSDIATFWYSLASSDRAQPMHVVMVCQSKEVEDDETGEIIYRPDVQKGAQSAFLASPDYVMYTDTETRMGGDLDAPKQHIVRFGVDRKYRTKARIPIDLRGRIPTILGRDIDPTTGQPKQVDLVQLGRILRVGGIPRNRPAPTASPAPAPHPQTA
jgi:energy-coupling factor transporter ATP-binding protein EcfA2